MIAWGRGAIIVIAGRQNHGRYNGHGRQCDLLAHVWLQFDAYWFLVLFLFLIIVHFLEA